MRQRPQAWTTAPASAQSIRHVVYYGLTSLALLWSSSCGDNVSPAVPTRVQVAANRSPSISGAIPEQALMIGPVTSTMDVVPYLTDPDGDGLTYAAVSSDVGVVSASVSGTTLTLTPVSAGAAIVSVRATDPGGWTATQQIAVTVDGDDPVPSTSSSDLVVESPSMRDRSASPAA